MARPRSFDVEVVLDAAGAVFRRLGYEAASVDDLVVATGLHRGSLYGAFGSKRGLFVAALGAGLAPLVAGAALPGTAFHDGAALDDALDLVLVAALELAPHDAEVREAIVGACDALDRREGGRAGVLGARLLQRAGLDLTSSIPTRPGRSA